MKTKKISIIYPFIICTFISAILSIQPTTLKADSVNPILITEIATAEPSDKEWIEIFNPNDFDIDLNELILFENDTNHVTTLKSTSSILKAKSFGLIVNKYEVFSEANPNILPSEHLILDSTWGSLSQDGESLKLILNDEVIEEATYQKFNNSIQREYKNEKFTNTWQETTQENSILQVSNTSTQEQDEQKKDTTCELPPIQTEYISVKPPLIKLSEVSFKDSEEDWIELYIDPYKQEVQQSDISIEIDGKNIINNDGGPLSKGFRTMNTSLTGTTEQIIVKYKNEPVDAICWSNNSPTQSEQTDIQNMISLEIWTGECLNSEEIQTNQSIVRTNFVYDNSLTNWTLSPTPTKGTENQIINKQPEAKIEIQSGKTESIAPLKINLISISTDPENHKLKYLWDFKNGETSNKENPNTISYETPGEYQISLTVTDQFGLSSNSSIYIHVLEQPKNNIDTTSAQENNSENTTTTNQNTDYDIKVSAFLPNPEGKDENKEWIEIVNLSNKTASLENWAIDDAEGQSSKYSLSNIELKPNEKYKIYDSDSRITLNNTYDEIRIIKPDGSIYYALNYSNAKENEIFITEDNEWKRYISNIEPETKTAFYEQIPEDITDEDANIERITEGMTNPEIRLTELLPNPEGEDDGNEWIEIYNPTPITTNLKNWKLKINGKEKLFNENDTIPENSYTAIDTQFKLPNSNAEIRLIDPKGIEQQVLNYKDAEENKSLFLSKEGEWKWTEYSTKGSFNPTFSEFEGKLNRLDKNTQTFHIKFTKVSYKDSQLNEILEDGMFISIETINTAKGSIITRIFNLDEIKETTTPTMKKTTYIIAISLLAIILVLLKSKLKHLISTLK
jgi:hypothetical protein